MFHGEIFLYRKTRVHMYHPFSLTISLIISAITLSFSYVLNRESQQVGAKHHRIIVKISVSLYIFAQIDMSVQVFIPILKDN